MFDTRQKPLEPLRSPKSPKVPASSGSNGFENLHLFQLEVALTNAWGTTVGAGFIPARASHSGHIQKRDEAICSVAWNLGGDKPRPYGELLDGLVRYPASSIQHQASSMRLVTFQVNGEERLGAWVHHSIFDLNACYSLYLTGVPREKMREIGPEALLKMEEKTGKELPTCMIDFLRLGDQAMQRAGKVLQRMAEFSTADLPECAVHRLDGVSLKAPVPRPGKILCLAGNYAEHIREGGREVTGKEKMAPRVFMKPNTAIIGADQPIVIPRKGNKIDWEAELAVVIGKGGKYIAQDHAYDYVAGYTIVNDVSERELIIDKNREPSEWNRFFDWLNGKWMDTFAPMGPCLVTKEEVGDPHSLRIRLKVNGETKQDSSTGNMIFNIPELIEFTSRLMTLEPGDIISTGTPSGVGASTGQFLKKGDVVEVEVENIGVLRNIVDVE